MGSLSQDEINALLAGVDMGSDRSLVVTAYGHGKVVDKIAVSCFDEYGYRANHNSKSYCDTINSLELKDGAWVVAHVVKENTPFSLDLFVAEDFDSLILSLDNRSLQKVLREMASWTLCKAIRGLSEELSDKFYSNMSKRAAQMLREDIEYQGPVRLKDSEEARQEIIRVIKHLEDTGEIVIRQSGDCL